MARFTADTAENYGGQGGHGFFSLKNDKDVAKVRFLYNTIEDVMGFAVHQVEVNGKKRYVDCKREYNEPVDNCPFCKDGRFQQAKIFIPVYDIASKQVKIWERGKKFFSQFEGIVKRLDPNAPICSQVFEIERNGKPQDTNTTYGIYAIGSPDGTKLSDLPEAPDILGSVVLDKSTEDMEYYVRHNEFPDNNTEEELPFRRGGNDEQRRTPGGRDRF